MRSYVLSIHCIFRSSFVLLHQVVHILLSLTPLRPVCFQICIVGIVVVATLPCLPTLDSHSHILRIIKLVHWVHGLFRMLTWYLGGDLLSMRRRFGANRHVMSVVHRWVNQIIVIIDYILSEHLLVLKHAAWNNVGLVSLMVDHPLCLSLCVPSQLLLVLLVEVVEHIRALWVTTSLFVSCNCSLLLSIVRCILRELSSMMYTNSTFLAIS